MSNTESAWIASVSLFGDKKNIFYILAMKIATVWQKDWLFDILVTKRDIIWYFSDKKSNYVIFS